MSRSQFYSIKLFILRHAWLNLWDKHMTTGRINQVTFLSERPRRCVREGNWIHPGSEELNTLCSNNYVPVHNKGGFDTSLEFVKFSIINEIEFCTSRRSESPRTRTQVSFVFARRFHDPATSNEAATPTNKRGSWQTPKLVPALRSTERKWELPNAAKLDLAAAVAPGGFYICFCLRMITQRITPNIRLFFRLH
jgi:hypothetical protein